MAGLRLYKDVNRFFAAINGDVAMVSGEEAAHMVRTLRMRPGDAFIAIDGSGWEYACTIEKTGGTVIADVHSKTRCAAEPGVSVTLYQAYPKAGKIETILQKCVELGITAFTPFLSERCVKRPENGEARVARLRRVAAEAVKQCGRAGLPCVSDIRTTREVLAEIGRHELVLFAWEEERSNTLKAALRAHPKAHDLAVVIGPEGGFSPEEAQAFAQAGAVSVSLGKRTLRTETAGMAALAAILYELED